MLFEKAVHLQACFKAQQAPHLIGAQVLGPVSLNGDLFQASLAGGAASAADRPSGVDMPRRTPPLAADRWRPLAPHRPGLSRTAAAVCHSTTPVGVSVRHASRDEASVTQ